MLRNKVQMIAMSMLIPIYLGSTLIIVSTILTTTAMKVNISDEMTEYNSLLI